MQERYRSEYDGEFVIVDTIWRNGRKEQQREWIENPIDMNLISPRAVIISNGKSRENFPVLRLQGHKGGLLGRKRLQSYGCNGVWRELQLDFYTSVDKTELEEVVQSGYNQNTTVYSSTKNCVRYPGEFYLVPYGVTNICAEALSFYLAAFDEHPEIYCVGVDGVDNNFDPMPKVINQIGSVIAAYKNTRFTFVNDSKVLHPEWRQHRNVNLITYQEFISYCDI